MRSLRQKRKRLASVQGERHGREIRVERLLKEPGFQANDKLVTLLRARRRVALLREQLQRKELALCCGKKSTG